MPCTCRPLPFEHWHSISPASFTHVVTACTKPDSHTAKAKITLLLARYSKITNTAPESQYTTIHIISVRLDYKALTQKAVRLKVEGICSGTSRRRGWQLHHLPDVEFGLMVVLSRTSVHTAVAAANELLHGKAAQASISVLKPAGGRATQGHMAQLSSVLAVDCWTCMPCYYQGSSTTGCAPHKAARTWLPSASR